MRELDTIQKKEKLNRVFAMDKEGNGGASHKYAIVAVNNSVETIIQFQHGSRNDKNSIHGVLGSDLLEIVRDTIKGFQNGPFASKENEKVLYHIEEALHQMNKRVEDRIKRNVLGKNEK